VVIHLGVVAFVALVLQLLALYAPLGDDDLPRRILIVSSYVLLLGFVLANLRRPGIVVLGIGLALNFTAIVANGGLMPISPETVADAHINLNGVSLSEWVPRSKDVLLAPEDTHLRFLTDIFVWRNPSSVRAFSIGDLVLAAGIVLTLADLLLPRVSRLPADRP